jgi:poly(ADP-ribose) glycohydrolase ARH3
LDLQDKFRGALVGAAIGDALGAPFEGASWQDAAGLIRRRIDSNGAWRYSDDTQMMFAVAHSVARHGAVEPESVLAHLAQEFDPARGYGKGVRRTIEAFRAGMPWHACAFTTWREGSRGNGAAARTAPVALALAHTSDEELGDACHWAARVTHAHPEAIEGALWQCLAVRFCLFEAPDASRERLLAYLEANVNGGTFETAVQRLRGLGSGAPNAEVVDALGNSVLAIESVPSAWWAAIYGGDDFAGCVQSAVALGGDTDTIGAMTGALCGARFGLDAIPVSWRERLHGERPGLADLVALAGGFYEQFASR